MCGQPSPISLSVCADGRLTAAMFKSFPCLIQRGGLSISECITVKSEDEQSVLTSQDVGRERSNQLSKGVRLWERRRRRRGVFDPGIHLAFMVWRRLRSPLNFVFRWREPERWEGGCGAGVVVPPHLGGTCVRTEGGRGGYRVEGYQKVSVHFIPIDCRCSMQVTIEVVDGLEAHEPEKGLRKETKPNWASPNWRNWWPRSSSPSSSTTHRAEEHDRAYGSNSEDSNFLRPPADWDRRGGTGGGGGGKTQTEYGEHHRCVCVCKESSAQLTC